MKRRRREPLGRMEPAELAIHRELTYLRAAARAARARARHQGRAVIDRSDAHAATRWSKLQQTRGTS